MADLFTARQDSPDEDARRAAEERARRIAALQAEIHQWDSKLETVRSQIESLITEQSNDIVNIG